MIKLNVTPYSWATALVSICRFKRDENRIKIINLLQDTPLNINRMAEVLDLDYKAVQHHVDVLEKNNLVSHMGVKYGIMYFVSNYLESNMDTFKEIITKINKSKTD